MLASLSISLGVFSLPLSSLSMYMGSPSSLPPPPFFPFGEGRKGRESLPPPLPDPPAELEGLAVVVHLHYPQHHRIGLLRRGYQPS